MKVIILNGSPKADGNTAEALHEAEKTLNQQGIETEWIHVGQKTIHACRSLSVLEHRPWYSTGRSSPRQGRNANHEATCPQHGVSYQVHPTRNGAIWFSQDPRDTCGDSLYQMTA